MLFQKRFWDGLRDGTVTLAFRRWKKPTVKTGGTLRSPGGLLAIEAVERVTVASITVAEARAAGFASRAALLRELASRTGALYRVCFAPAGPDPRDALREETGPGALAEVEEKLARTDARSATGPWTAQTLALIEARPGTRAGDLAPEVGLPLKEFKAKVRRLKQLGLTRSEKVGYRLTARGEALLAARRPSQRPET